MKLYEIANKILTADYLSRFANLVKAGHKEIKYKGTVFFKKKETKNIIEFWPQVDDDDDDDDDDDGYDDGYDYLISISLDDNVQYFITDQNIWEGGLKGSQILNASLYLKNEVDLTDLSEDNILMFIDGVANTHRGHMPIDAVNTIELVQQALIDLRKFTPAVQLAIENWHVLSVTDLNADAPKEDLIKALLFAYKNETEFNSSKASLLRAAKSLKNLKKYPELDAIIASLESK